MRRFINLVENTLNKVGKKTPSEWYGHIDAVDHGNSNISPKQLEMLNNARQYVPKDFDFDFVAISPKEVRFLKMSDLEDPHPVVEESLKVSPDGVKVRGKIGNQIYHRLETMVDPEHYTYPFHKAVTEWEETRGLLRFDGKPPSGSYNAWLRQIYEKTGLQEKDLENMWNKIKQKHLRSK